MCHTKRGRYLLYHGLEDGQFWGINGVRMHREHLLAHPLVLPAQPSFKERITRYDHKRQGRRFPTGDEHAYLIASSPNHRSLSPDIITIKAPACHHNGKDQRGTLSLISPPLAHPSVQKLSALRSEADTAVTRAEAAEAKNKQYEQQILEKEQSITSLNVQIARLEGELQATEDKLSEAKSAQADGEHSKTTNDSLARKIVLLEEELDAAEKNVKETTEKCVVRYHKICC